MQRFFITLKSQKIIFRWAQEPRRVEAGKWGNYLWGRHRNPQNRASWFTPSVWCWRIPQPTGPCALHSTKPPVLIVHMLPGGGSWWLHFGVTTRSQHTVVQNEACLGLSLMSEDQTAWGPQVLIRLESGWHFHK